MVRPTFQRSGRYSADIDSRHSAPTWPRSRPHPAPELDFPVWHEELAKGPAFIGYLNFLLGHAKPNPADANALKRFAAIGIGPGKSFDAAKLDKETATAIKAGIDAALKKLNDRVATNKDNIGLFGSREYLKGDYESRAIGAMIGIYGQNEQDAVYFSYQADKDGKPLDGTKSYELMFKEAPPVSQFWSLTMYNLPQRLLVDNAINRYSIGDRTEGLVKDEQWRRHHYPEQRRTPAKARTGCRRQKVPSSW